ncbi:threonine/serine exporter family protein [Schinkia sp. CFF1]
MFFLNHLVTSFIASAAFGILFNVPRNTLLKCGFVGMVGWFIYIVLESRFEMDAMVATLIASAFISIISQTFAKIYKTPIIVFNVSGIIPLVPGGMAYDSMRHFVENDYNMAVQLAAKAFMISGSIAIGLVFSEVFNQVIRKAKI